MAETRAMGTICANCLSKLRISTSTPVSRVPHPRSFHYTLPSLNVVKRKTAPNAGAKQFALRESKSAVFKRKPREKPVIPPVGQRKTERKRIVLSNTNALMIDDMQELSLDNMADSGYHSSVLGLPWPILDQLGNAEAFKTTQKWHMFRRPATLMRKESLEIAQMIKNINASFVHERDIKPSADVAEPSTASSLDGSLPAKSAESGLAAKRFSKVQRAILDGPQGGGKSLMLVQAIAMGFLNNWIVINFPEAQDWTIAHSSYKPAPSTTDEGEQLFIQPQLTSDLLKRIVKSNEKVLSRLGLVHEHQNLRGTLQKNTNLERLALRGVSNPSEAPEVFNALWKELTVPAGEGSQSRPPLMVCIDSINHWMTNTAYRAPDYCQIHAYKFGLIRHFLDLLFKQAPTGPNFGPSGGIILGATSGSNVPGNETLDIALRELSTSTVDQDGAKTQSLQQFAEVGRFRTSSPYNKLDKHVLQLFSTPAANLAVAPYSDHLQLRHINGLSRSETRGLLEYFARSGLLREKITDELVAEKWSLSSSGLVGYVEKAAARLRT